jgi:serine/threonine protein kinase
VSDASAQPRRIGRYEIVGALAHGGMAELFVAHLPGIEGFDGFAKRVVLKRVLPQLASDREFVDMFLAEARIAATLDHQNIVQVHDIGQDADGYFFAMELLHGADVGDMLRATQHRGGLPLPVALEVARAACAGLHYAHERTGPTGAPLGLVHRDISPQNLFVTFDGAVKLLDWGIAKAVQRISNHYTRSGTLRGKIPYMSPEQCRGEPLDRRSDVFSLAVVLWEMTVGERLFGARGESDFDTLKQIIEHDAPAPGARAAGYPPELERIVMKGMRRDPRERYQTADALQVDLEGFMRASSRWASTRDLAAFMTATYPERAAETRRTEPTPPAKAGRIVPFPRPHAADAPVPGRATVELPIEDALASAPTVPATPSLMPLPAPGPP